MEMSDGGLEGWGTEGLQGVVEGTQCPVPGSVLLSLQPWGERRGLNGGFSRPP
jgi:hypothetical protein